MTVYRRSLCKDVVDSLAKGMSFVAWCAKTDVSEKTGHEWKKMHPEFKAAYERAQAKLEAWVISDAAKPTLSQTPAVWIFLAANLTKMRRTDESNTTKIIGDPEQPLVTAIKDLSDDELVAKMRERGIAFEA